MMDRDAIALPSHLGLDDKALLAECIVDIYRASGPGGQKRNKTGSAVRLRHQPTGINVTAVESRSQHENRARALKRLRQGIALHVRRPVDPDGYVPSPLLRTCLSEGGKLSIGRRDFRYHAAVWEILDLLAACGVQVATTAARLGVTTGNLVHFFSGDPALWRRVNEMRLAAGLKHLK